MDQPPPPGSFIGIKLSANKVKFWFALSLPQENKHKFPLILHFLIDKGCHSCTVIFLAFFLKYLFLKRRLLTQCRRRNLLKRGFLERRVLNRLRRLHHVVYGLRR